MKKVTMMTALVVSCFCVGAAMAEPEQKKPAPRNPRMERRQNREGAERRAERRAEMAANRFRGKVVAKDGATVTVKNVRQERKMTFTAKTDAAKKMLDGIAVDDFVGVRFTKADEGFTLDGIRKVEGRRPGGPEGARDERRLRKGDGEGRKDAPAMKSRDEGKRKAKDDAKAEKKAKGEGKQKADCADCPKAKQKAKGEGKQEAKAEGE